MPNLHISLSKAEDWCLVDTYVILILTSSPLFYAEKLVKAPKARRIKAKQQNKQQKPKLLSLSVGLGIKSRALDVLPSASPLSYTRALRNILAFSLAWSTYRKVTQYTLCTFRHKHS